MKILIPTLIILGSIICLSGCGTDNSAEEFEAYSEVSESSPEAAVTTEIAVEPVQKEETVEETVSDTAKLVEELVEEKPQNKPAIESQPNAPVAKVDTPSKEVAIAEPAKLEPVLPAIAEKPEVIKTPAEDNDSEIVKKQERAPVKAPRDVELVVAEEPEKREIKLLITEPPVFKKVGKERALRVSFDDLDLLRLLNMDPVPVNAVDYFPPWLNELEGKTIRLRGFMYPPYQETGIKRFLFARDNDICCFGRDPKEYDIISVKMKEGTETDYIPNRPFDVIATFHIRPKKWDDEKLLRLYALEDAVIINK